MKMKTKTVLDLIGNTPLVKIEENVFAKLESINPSGSIKDRMALYMLNEAEKNGQLKKGYRIIEATSGNTGISFAMITALKGYKFTAIMAKTMSIERRQMMRAFGADFILTQTTQDAVRKAEKFAKKPKVWVPGQFRNKTNVDCHRETTGKEILEQIDNIGAFVAGIGTGGTLMGVAQALRKKFPNVKIIAVEPAESAVLSGGKPCEHEIQGIGAGFVPRIVNTDKIDGVIAIKSNDAIKMARKLAKEKGLFVGISSGANVLAALEIAKKIKEKNVVTILPDSADRYLSMGIFE